MKESTFYFPTLFSLHKKAHLAFSVDSYDATASLMDCSDKDGFTADAVHVDAGASLKVVQMNIAKLGDQVDHIMLSTHLSKKKREIELLKC